MRSRKREWERGRGDERKVGRLDVGERERW